MPRASLFFTGPRRVEALAQPWPTPGPGQVLVRSLCSAISSGTELLIYRGEAPTDLAADATIAALSGTLAFPLQYGYSTVGRVIECGPGVEAGWRDRLVVAFNPHESHFAAAVEGLIALPPDLALEDAVFLPNLETAVNLLHDGAPLVGERVAVFGQGIIGLLATELLARLPLARFATFDCYSKRRELSLRAGAHTSVDPSALAGSPDLADFDLVFEISGSPAALNQAIAAAGFGGRVVIGSWYGIKPVTLDLGGRFHRSRIQLIDSQVSTLSPNLTGRWTKRRRLDTCLSLLSQIRPARYVTHRFPLAQAAQAYDLLDQRPSEAIQVLLTYPD